MLVLGLFAVFAELVLSQAGQLAAPVAPKLELLYRTEVQLGQRFSMGPVPSGKERIVIPIVGGDFKGPKISGKIINLGADWRLTDVNGKYRPDARYNLQISDGTWVYVQTEGPTLDDGRSLLRAKFETATNGTYSWLNDVVAIGILNRSGDKVFIDMWSASPGGPA